MGRHWYVIRTSPQSEHIAAAALQRERFELFFPRVRTPEQAGREDTPLFPGYLFLRRDTGLEELPRIDRLPGVLGWVRFGGVAPPVPDDVIDRLSRRVDEINAAGGLWSRFRRGQMVRVVSGKIEGLAQVLEEPKSPQARVRVLLEFMGRMVPAEVERSSLRPASPQPEAPEGRRRGRRTRGKGRWIRGYGPRAAGDALAREG